MDLTRLRTGEKIAGIAGLAFIIIMFLHWWKASGLTVVNGQAIAGTVYFNAWEPADFMDIIWFICGLSGVALAAISAYRMSVNLPVAMSAITTALGGVGTLLAFYRLINPPYSLGRSYGIWLGLIAIAAMTYGAYLAMQEEGTTLSAEADRLRSGRRGPGSPSSGG
jgi:hypothetical protein